MGFFLSPHPQPSYLLLAPKALQHGIPTSISVTILIPSPVTVSAHIVRGNLTLASQSVKVEGGKYLPLTINLQLINYSSNLTVKFSF